MTAPDAEPVTEPEQDTVPSVSAPKGEAPAAEEPTRDGTRATHTYVEVTQPTPGKKYLITYTEGTAAAVMTYNYYSSNYRPSATVVSVSDGTITGDYDSYLFGVEYYNGYYWLGNLNKLAYLSMDYSNDYPYYGYNSNYDSYSDWTYSTSSKTLQNRGNGGYLYLGGSSSNGWYFTSSTSGDPITFYELVEEDVTGTNFYRITELKVGDKVIIAHNDQAMGNTLVSSNRRLNPVRVAHVVAGNEHITVPTNQVSTVQWEVVSGNATNGFVLKNVANNRYLTLDSAGYVTTTNSTSGVATWKYNGTDLSSSKSSSYPYLKFSNEFINFDTASSGNRDIRIYAAIPTYTVTFKDGVTNATLKTEQVEQGASATAPSVPEHTGYVFTGWDKAYDNVTENLTVTAQYTAYSDLKYTVTFRYMNSNGQWVTTVRENVQHGTAATPPSVPTPPSGYTFNSWDKKYNNITSNLTINAVYKRVATEKHVITLRAVYGRANTTATTHIYWYANNDESLATGGDLQKNEGLAINQAITIPTPDLVLLHHRTRDRDRP